MSLLNKLTKFYKDEAARLPHDKAEIWDLAWSLASVIENFPMNFKSPANYDGSDEFLTELKTKPSAALIDIAVDALHQTLLTQSGENYELVFHWLAEDIKEYLLSRNNNDTISQETQRYAEAEEKALLDLDALEEEFWREMDEEGY